MDVKDFFEKDQTRGIETREEYGEISFISPVNIKISNLKKNEKVKFFDLTFEGVDKAIRKDLFGLNMELLDSGNFSYTEDNRVNNPHDLRNFSNTERINMATYETILYGKLKDFEKIRKDIMIAFWIYKKGRASLPLYFLHNGYGWQNYQYNYEKEKYIVTKKELKEIENIIISIQKEKEKRSEILKLRFSELLKGKNLSKNRFIDAVTIIESLITSDTKAEKSFKFSLYASFILKKYSNIDISFSKLNKIYEVRSQLLHSGDSKNYSEDLLEEVKIVVRELLKLYFFGKIKFNEKEIKKALLGDLKIE